MLLEKLTSQQKVNQRYNYLISYTKDGLHPYCLFFLVDLNKYLIHPKVQIKNIVKILMNHVKDVDQIVKS